MEEKIENKNTISNNYSLGNDILRGALNGFTFGNTNYSYFSLDDKKSCKETIELYEKVCNIESTQDKELKNICKELLKELKNIC